MSIPAPPCLLAPPDKCLVLGRRGRAAASNPADTAPTTRRHRKATAYKGQEGASSVLGGCPYPVPFQRRQVPRPARAPRVRKLFPPLALGLRGRKAPETHRHAAPLGGRPRLAGSVSDSVRCRHGLAASMPRAGVVSPLSCFVRFSDLFGRRYPSSSSATSTPRAAAMASA